MTQILELLAGKMTATPSLSLASGSTGNLFIHSMPAAARQGVMVRYYFGGVVINAELPHLRKTKFQLIVRDTDYQRAETQSRAIAAALKNERTVEDRDLPGIELRYLRATHDPYPYPLSAGGQWEFLTTFDVCWVDLA